MSKTRLLCGLIPLVLLPATARPDPPEDRAKPVLTLRGHSGPVTCVRFSPDGTRLATGGQDNAVLLWDAGTGKQQLALDGLPTTCHGNLTISPDGRVLVSSGCSAGLQVWDTTTGRPILVVPADRETNALSMVDFRHGVRYLTAAHSRWKATRVVSNDKPRNGSNTVTEASMVSSYNPRTGKRTVTEAGLPVSGVWSMAHSPDGRRLAVGWREGEVTVYETATWSATLTIRGPNRGATVLAVALSPDGRRVAAAGDDGVVRVWSLRTGKECLTLKGHKGQAERVAFDPSGKWLASAGRIYSKEGPLRWHGEVVIWDARTGTEWFALLLSEKEVVYDLCFSPCGTRLATAHGDGTVKVWRVKDLCVP